MSAANTTSYGDVGRRRTNIPNSYVPTVPTPSISSGTIDIDEFENADDDEFAEQNDIERIVLFLQEHDNRAWKAATIAEHLELETDAVSAILSRLKERGLVRHKRPYWAITDDEDRLRAAYRLHRQYETADEQYGEEHLEELRTAEMAEVK